MLWERKNKYLLGKVQQKYSTLMENWCARVLMEFTGYAAEKLFGELFCD